MAVAALASCSKIDVEYDAPAEIGLSPVAQNITRSMVSGTTFPEEQFNVWAFYKQMDAGTSIADWQKSTLTQQRYIDHKPFKKKEGKDLWGGLTPYYWPKVGSLLFAGYYPVNDALKAKVSYLFDTDNNTMTIAGYTPGNYKETGFVNNAENADHVEDLMYFNMTATSYDGTTVGEKNTVTTGSNVDVVFRHALSWITVKVAKGEDTPEDATITVNSVTFTDVKTTGTGTVDNSATTEDPKVDPKEITWVTTEDETDIVVFEGTEVLGDAKALPKEPVIIPQTMAGSLVVNYTISSGDYSSFTEEKTITLSGMNDSDGNSLTKWLAAKHYIYTITIGTTEILIDPAVTAWDEVTVGVPVQ